MKGIKISAAAVVAASALAISGCATSSTDEAASDTGEELQTVRVALDWTPNGNHAGLYMAMDEGYFAEEGIEIEVVPYNATAPDALVDAGTADFGFTFQDAATFSIAAGANNVSVFGVIQDWAYGVAVMADRDDIQSPKDLDGLTYGAIGNPGEEQLVKALITNDGGTGDIDYVTMGGASYEAMYDGEIDASMPFYAGEALDFEMRGTPVKFFKFTDYGFPSAYQMVMVGNKTWIEENPELTQGFVTALQRGYEDAAADSVAAAETLMEMNPGVFTDEEFLFANMELVSEQFLEEDGSVGSQTLEKWTGLSEFLLENGLLSDANGEVITEAPDWSTYFTDEFVN